MRLALLLVVTLGLSAAAQEKVDPKQALKQLQGTWEVTGLEVDGIVQSKDKTPTQIVVTGDKLKLASTGPEMTIKLNPAKSPKWIDLTFQKDGMPISVKAIYEVSGENLKLCIPIAEKGKLFENLRPENFETKGKFVALFQAKRPAKD
jgi:uncharacterized protein (TIGR03067 family)